MVVCASLLLAPGCSTRTYDLVISNGHVMDPESGFDRIAHVGIVGDRVEAISDGPLQGNGPIGLQWGEGDVKFRNVKIRRLE